MKVVNLVTWIDPAPCEPEIQIGVIITIEACEGYAQIQWADGHYCSDRSRSWEQIQDLKVLA